MKASCAVGEFVPPRYAAYLENLQQRSRKKRHQHTPKLQRLREKREREFCLYFNISQPETFVASKSIRSFSNPPLPARSVSAPSLTSQRKLWGNTRRKFNIKTDGGDTITYAPEDYYSDDFEEVLSSPLESLSDESVTFAQDVSFRSDRAAITFSSDSEAGSETELVAERVREDFSSSLPMYLQLDIFSNWGDNVSVGLSRIEVHLDDQENSSLPVTSIEVRRYGSQEILIPVVPIKRPFLYFKRCHLPASAIFYLDRQMFLNSGAQQLSVKILNFDVSSYHSVGVKNCRLILIFQPTGDHYTIFEGDLQMYKEQNYQNEVNTFYAHLNYQELPDILKCGAIQAPASPGLSSSTRNKNFLKFSSDTLNYSWGCLELFRRVHAGRLSIESQNESNISIVRDSLEDIEADEVNEEILKEEENTSPVTDSSIDFQLLSNSSEQEDESEFVIPELPSGRELLIEILSTWGDPHYVGLTGVQIFSADGFEISANSTLSAFPEGLNVLPEFASDPRVITNLVDGINETKDETHMWLAPFVPGKHNWVKITLVEEEKAIALIRLWNYNGSRVHSARGARDVQLFLNGECIFRGQITRASGLERGRPEEFGETILFTTDEAILQRIAKHDSAFLRILDLQEDEEELAYPLSGGLRTRWLDIHCVDVWDEANPESFVGLTGIRVFVDPRGDMSAPVSSVECVSSSLTPVYANSLINGVNITTNEAHMWKHQFNRNEGKRLRVWMPSAGGYFICGIQLWNYNGSSGNSRIGVRTFALFDDSGCSVGGPRLHLLRRAPGHVKYDYSQRFMFAEFEKITIPPNFGLEGCFVITLSFLSNWGDLNHIGLNRLQLFYLDGNGIRRELVVPSDRIFLFPGLLSELDLLTPNGDSWNPRRLLTTTKEAWSAPICPGQPNEIFFVFDVLVRVVGVCLWNYSLKDSIGVCEFTAHLDDKLVFSGVLPPSSQENSNGGTSVWWKIPGDSTL